MTQMQRWWRFGLPMVAGVSLLTAALADFLFYDQIVGWTLGGFVAWLLLLMLLRDGRKLLRGPRWAWGWALSLMTTGLCVSLVLEPGTIAVVLSLIMLTTLAMLAHGWRSRSLGWRWLGQLVMSWAMAISRPIRDSRLARKWAHRTQGLRSRAIGIARWVWTFAGIFIPLLLSLVFLSLFALANPVVSDWMSRSADKVGDFFSNLTDYVTFGRILLWYAAAFACWGLLRHRPRRASRIVKLGRNLITQVADLRPANATDETVDAHPINLAAAQKRAAQQESTEGDIEEAAAEPDKSTKEDVFAWLSGKYTNLIVRCLIAMNLVFALQLVLDSRYLVLGQDLPEGMSYAEYAHRGAYPLIATAILAAALVLAVFRPGGIAQRSKLAVWLVILWIAQNIVLVASAAWRLQAYVEVYTLTRLRVAAAVWMLMVAGCLALLLWRIARSRDNNWLTGWAMGWGIAVLWVCSFVPFDPLVANYNVRNCKEMGGEAGALDLAYLESLGPDALPAVAYLIENLPQEAASAPPAFEPKPSYGRGSRVEQIEYDEEGRVVAVKFVGLGEELAAMRDRLSDDLDEQLDGWRGWTVRRAWLDESVSD
ncbi:MAG: DUF4173 domain-containing protein [Phycisphaeraceae bacterium]